MSLNNEGVIFLLLDLMVKSLQCLSIAVQQLFRKSRLTPVTAQFSLLSAWSSIAILILELLMRI